MGSDAQPTDEAKAEVSDAVRLAEIRKKGVEAALEILRYCKDPIAYCEMHDCEACVRSDGTNPVGKKVNAYWKAWRGYDIPDFGNRSLAKGVTSVGDLWKDFVEMTSSDEQVQAGAKIGHEFAMGILRTYGEADLLKSDHSSGFRDVIWYGDRYKFTPNQAACVKLLWENWGKGVPSTGHEELLQAAGVGENSKTDARSIFKSSQAWGTMIREVRDRKGLYQLVTPDYV